MAAVLGSAAHAQMPLTPETTGESPVIELGGVATIDVITIDAQTLGIPLRRGALIPGSERVEFNGRTLKKGTDYAIDYAAGVLYLMRAAKQGQMIRVGYRWDDSKEAQAKVKNVSSGIAPISFNILPGQRMLVGFGMTERTGDGNVVQSNVFGWNNAMRMNGLSTDGLFMMGQRQKVRTESNYEYERQAGQTETGKSHFALQKMALELGGGSVEVNYQDISKNFTGFSAAASSGVAQDAINQLQKERGLKRFGFSMKDVGSEDFKISSGYRKVGDGKDDIEWQNLGLASGGFAINWNQQKVGDHFKRFQDIAEKDREQLKKEIGMERETLGVSFAQKTTKMALNMSTVTDPSNAEINRREWNFETPGVKLSMGDQEVDKDFRRMGSLLGQEQAMWGRELGMKRQWANLQTTLFGAGMPVAFNQSILQNGAGAGYAAQDFSIKGSGWSLESSVRAADPEFNNFGAMQDAERNEHINSIGRMYDPNGVPLRGEEVAWFMRSSGISRGLTRFNAQPFKDWKFRADRVSLEGEHDGATVDSVLLEGKQLRLNYRKQDLGDRFDELNRLLDLERWRLGTISGLERTDFNVSYQFSPNRSFLYAKMAADAPNGGASREQVVYKDKGIDVQVTTREVDPGFNNVNQLVDPEKDFLATLRGFKERDVKATWQVNANLKFDLFMLDSASDSLDQTRYIRSGSLAWNPDKQTQLRASRHEQRNDDPLNVLFANTIESVSITRNFGALGTVRYAQESKDYDGTQTQLSDSRRESIGYEAQLNPKTKFSTEAVRTRWDDGAKEDVNTHSVSTELSKNVGVSVTDVKIDREGEERDEKRVGYGFWWDFGGGMRLVYGFSQHLAGTTAIDTKNQNVQLSGGQVGNVQVGNGTYQQNEWEGGRTQALGNIGVSTVKPMRFLGFTDLKINASLDTAADRKVWMKENQVFGISGKLGGNALGFDYRSQIAPNSRRGIDRSVFFTTDQDEKKPLRLNLKYKQRNLPNGDEVHIRDYGIAARLMRGVEVSHNLLTHPEVARGDAILGSITTARQVNRWRLDVKMTEDTTIGGQWEELIDQGRPMTRVGGLNVALFKKSGSPLQLFYGVEQSDAQNRRTTTHRYHLRFDQRPGPNQAFSLFVGNVSHQHGMNQSFKRNNLTVQLDFQLKF